ncbi:MAG: hypothetical protein FJ399_06795 [Verrucomicrobia bacterium]|nr:hypothetical protein [Verrucomicrobiota bacterium]
MSWFRKYPLFALAISVCTVIALGEVAFVYERFAASREAARRLAQRKVEHEGMAQLLPPPTREVAATIEADLAKAQRSLAAMQGELTGRGPAAERLRSAKVPTARTDAFFDLAAFVERMRALAETSGVEVRPEAARFGFSAYANEGPETDRIEPVFRQRQVTEYLLEALLAARPRALFSVKRERTLTKAEREARAAAAAEGAPPEEPAPDPGSDSPDYFGVGPGVSARVRGYVDSTAFRLVFTGQTAALRSFLNKLASFELPVLVREVEVDAATAEEAVATPNGEEAPTRMEPTDAAAASVVLSTESSPAKGASPAKAAPGKAAAAARAPRAALALPIVSKSLSKYTVTVEFIELVAAQPPAGEAPPPTS